MGVEVEVEEKNTRNAYYHTMRGVNQSNHFNQANVWARAVSTLLFSPRV